MDASLLRTRYETALSALASASEGRYAVPRIIPVIEAMSAIVLADFALMQRCARIENK